MIRGGLVATVYATFRDVRKQDAPFTAIVLYDEGIALVVNFVDDIEDDLGKANPSFQSLLEKSAGAKPYRGGKSHSSWVHWASVPR